jgi:succinoglycan biosynthesis protein ExoV
MTYWKAERYPDLSFGPRAGLRWNPPRTAKACGLTPDKVAGDAAILMNRYRKRPQHLSSRIAFMPHWESLERGDWQTACRLAGIHLIDPRRSVAIQKLRRTLESRVLEWSSSH